MKFRVRWVSQSRMPKDELDVAEAVERKVKASMWCADKK